ncbi:MAG: biotin-dependent carboxyltransferase family protein [Saprospiraceae bacterium]|nr:biotin-dependent carboxyltransferase family protein [Lewinella sp.]
MPDRKANWITMRILKPGMLSLLQDAGRNGYQAFGLPIGGALDRQAAQVANWLLEQSPDHPVLEITLLGPEIEFEGPIQIALTGADLSPQINGQPAAMYRTLSISAGDHLSFGTRVQGCRAYLGVRGDWDVPTWLGSQSALRVGGQIWPSGSVLERGQQLRIRGGTPIESRQVKKRPFYSAQATLRLIPGPEFDRFSPASIDYLTSHAFTLSPDCSRMGYRLEEGLPDYRPGGELISSGIVPGTIQVLPSGKLIVLLADAQTTGGYPRLANIQDRDLDVPAQLAPGDKVRFLLDN